MLDACVSTTERLGAVRPAVMEDFTTTARVTTPGAASVLLGKDWIAVYLSRRFSRLVVGRLKKRRLNYGRRCSNRVGLGSVFPRLGLKRELGRRLDRVN